MHYCFRESSLINLCIGVIGSGTESESDESVPDLEEQDSAQTQTQQAQVRRVSSYRGKQMCIKNICFVNFNSPAVDSSVMIETVTFVLLSFLKPSSVLSRATVWMEMCSLNRERIFIEWWNVFNSLQLLPKLTKNQSAKPNRAAVKRKHERYGTSCQSSILHATLHHCCPSGGYKRRQCCSPAGNVEARPEAGHWCN